MPTPLPGPLSAVMSSRAWQHGCLALLAVAALLSASGCAAPSSLATEAAVGARVKLQPTQAPPPVVGVPVGGELHFRPAGRAVRVTGLVTGLKPLREHAFHIHEAGDCSAPDAASAGGHANPTPAPHGAYGSAAAHHVGDLPVLRADVTGRAAVDFTSQTLMLDGPHRIIGKVVIVYRDSGDVSAEAAGNGARLACGVIR